MVVLNKSVRLIALQFSFSNPDVIPQGIKRAEKETFKERNDRKSRSSGVMVIEPTENCSLVEFLGELETAGYEMVDAFHKERIDQKSRGKRYHMVRFLFARCEFVNLSKEFAEVRDNIYGELLEMCRMAMWRVRIFSNPFYENGREEADQRALSINLESRKPLFSPDGQPIKVWQKDKKGRRIGNTPLPLKPDCSLYLIGNAINLISENGRWCI